MSIRTNCPTSQIAPIRTSSPPSTIDELRDRRGAWLSAMGQPYPATGGCQGPPPGFGPHGRGGTEVVQHTLRATWGPGDADSAPMQDQPQAAPRPFRRWDQLRDVGFDLDGVGALGQPKAPREPLDVGIDREARHAEGDTEYDIGGLAADPGQRDQVVDVARDLAAEALDQRRAGRDDRLRFDVEEAGGLDHRLDLPGIRVGQRGRIRIPGK